MDSLFSVCTKAGFEGKYFSVPEANDPYKLEAEISVQNGEIENLNARLVKIRFYAEILEKHLEFYKRESGQAKLALKDGKRA